MRKVLGRRKKDSKKKQNEQKPRLVFWGLKVKVDGMDVGLKEESEIKLRA